MDQILEELKLVPGVIGAFVFHTRDGIVAKALPAIFKDKKLIQMGKHVLKIYAAVRMGISKVSDISIFYEESVLTFRPVDKRHCIIVLVDPGANANLISMSLNLAIEELRSASTLRKKPARNHAETTPYAKVASPDSGNVEKLMKEGVMAESLRDMERSLAKVMGPIAKVMFRDALRLWVRSSEPSFSNVPALIDILRNEINNPEQFIRFRERVVSYVAIDN